MARPGGVLGPLGLVPRLAARDPRRASHGAVLRERCRARSSNPRTSLARASWSFTDVFRHVLKVPVKRLICLPLSFGV